MPAAPDHRAEAEEWFLEHGLPWFVDGLREEVARRAHRGRVTAVVVAGLVLGFLTSGAVGPATGQVSTGIAAGASVFAVVVVVYALWALHASLIARWALGRAFGSLRLLLPLATRALPLLLLFVTFLFINADLWQVAARLHGGILWSAILFFIVAALGFLVPRLAQELDQVDDTLDQESLCAATEGTPLAEPARRLCEADADLTRGAEITGLQKVNLVTALTIAQAVQVLLLSVAVFLFFIVFGLVAIQDTVIENWIGHGPTYPPGPHVVSLELIRVATFLAGFSGFYFTLTSITDETYRQEFFSVILAELQSAVAARVVYQSLGEQVRDAGTPGPPAPAG